MIEGAYGSVAIIGAGPAGSALAASLAQGELEVHLFEKGRFPRDKLCGEFLSSEAKRLFERMGCWSAIAALEPARIHNARFRSAGGQVLELALPAPCFGLSRAALDRELFAHARRAGARTQVGVEVHAIEPRDERVLILAQKVAEPDTRVELAADLAIGAHGRRSRLDHQLRRPFTLGRHPHLGFKQHHRPRAGRLGRELERTLEGYVEIHAVEGGYCGLSFVEDGRVNVCLLVEERSFRELDDRSMPSVLGALASRSPSLARRLEALEPGEGAPLAVAQVPFVAKEPARDGILFVGDAAGMIAPLAGDGQAMAIESALLLADLIERRGVPRSRKQRDALARAWSIRWTREYRARLELGRGLQAMLLRRRVADRALSLLGLSPALTSALVRFTRSEA